MRQLWKTLGWRASIAFAAAAVFLAGACSSTEGPAPTPIPTVTPQPTATPPPQATPQPTATPQPLPVTPSDIYNAVVTSTVIVETPANSGTGVLIEGDYILASAHVVSSFANARLLFPDGTEISDAPVIHFDYMLDIAILGPLRPRQGR